MELNQIKSTNIRQPYKWKTTKGSVVLNYHSAHTIKNKSWKWWKFWIDRFISVPAGWRALFNICGNIELDLSEKPD